MNKRIILPIIILLTCFACQKEKFETTGNYLVTIKLYVTEGADTLSVFSTTETEVQLRNETETTIQYVNNLNSATQNILLKVNRNLTGLITHHHLGIWDADSAYVDMARERFGKNISGSIRAKCFYAPKWWDAEGTIFLEYDK